MPEQTFKSPGYFDREIDLSARVVSPTGVPAGVIGTALRGPAFVPVTVGSFADFEDKFGTLDPKLFGPYVVKKFLDNRPSVTYMRVLGAGANDTTDDIATTKLTGQVKSAGFVVTGTAGTQGDLRHLGAVQFLVAEHTIQTNETLGMPIFTDNDSFVATSTSDTANIVRAAIFAADGARVMILDGNEAVPSNANTLDDVASLSGGKFKLAISSSTAFNVYTASLNPSDVDYISKILNTNPEKFGTENHLLYLDFAVDDEIATVSTSNSIAIVSGSAKTSTDSGDLTMTTRDAFGHFDTRFQTARTTWFISQPFGLTENNLFYFEALDDGVWPNDKIKVSITNLRGSTNPKSNYGTFTVQIRSWSDTDTNPEILEQFTGCTLDPTDENYVAKKIGDRKVEFAFDSDSDDERRIKTSGKYANKSRYVRIRMNESVEKKLVPAKSLPFGFRGIPTLKTNDLLVDSGTLAASSARFAGDVSANGLLTSSLVPPIPFRFKTTRGNVATSGFPGAPGTSEEADGRYYWGVKLERNKSPLNANATREKNASLVAYSKLVGLSGLDVLLTGSAQDTFNENKFSLSRVAFSNALISELTGTVKDHIREAAYLRNGDPDGTEYKINDGVLASSRLTLGTLVALTSSADFNRFTDYTKFTNIFYGGFDGVNILDTNAARLNDKASSSDTGGGAASGYLPTGLDNNPAGTGKLNNAVNAYRTAARIMLDPFTLSSNFPNMPSINLLAIPGIRDSFVTDYVATSAKEFGMALYLMDVPAYDDQNTRLFGDETTRPDVEKTSQQFDSRAIDNNYTAAYFPDVIMVDEVNNRRVKVPSSVAAMAAIGFSDRVGFPWFAPAGFNRGALDFVTGLDVRLKVEDRDTLYDNRINPIANIIEDAQTSYVVFGQKTLQQAKSALDRVNVRRLMLELRRIVTGIAKALVFEQNNSETRGKFVTQTSTQLGLIQTQAGIEKYRVIMDESNNTKDDEEQNRMNGKIIVVPTRAVEFIAVDFIITNSGVSFDT